MRGSLRYGNLRFVTCGRSQTVIKCLPGSGSSLGVRTRFKGVVIGELGILMEVSALAICMLNWGTCIVAFIAYISSSGFMKWNCLSLSLCSSGPNVLLERVPVWRISFGEQTQLLRGEVMPLFRRNLDFENRISYLLVEIGGKQKVW